MAIRQMKGAWNFEEKLIMEEGSRIVFEEKQIRLVETMVLVLFRLKNSLR